MSSKCTDEEKKNRKSNRGRGGRRNLILAGIGIMTEETEDHFLAPRNGRHRVST